MKSPIPEGYTISRSTMRDAYIVKSPKRTTMEISGQEFVENSQRVLWHVCTRLSEIDSSPTNKFLYEEYKKQ